MSKVSIKLHDRDYAISCGTGEENRLSEVVKFVDRKMKDIAKQNNNIGETRLFMLTCLMIADELFEIHKTNEIKMLANEELMVAAVDHLKLRVAHIANQVGRA